MDELPDLPDPVPTSSRRRFLKMGLYIAPAVLAANALASTAHATGSSEGSGSPGSGGGSENGGGGSENGGGGSENGGGGSEGGGGGSENGTHGEDVSSIARTTTLEGREKGQAISEAAKNKE